MWRNFLNFIELLGTALILVTVSTLFALILTFNFEEFKTKIFKKIKWDNRLKG